MRETPVQVPGFTITRELGRGASGVVYLARETALGRNVALKVLRADVSHAPEVRARFEREVRAAARVRHPHIVPVLSTGETAGRLWYTMELVDGPSLAQVLAEAPGRRLPKARAVRIVLETARVLAAAHAAGVTHRDVKPANVVLLEEPVATLESSTAGPRLRESWIEPRGGPRQADRPRLMDFGLASDAAAARLSESGMLIGTPGYMAPEQFRGRTGEVGPAADQWALGVMLYELLTGHLPFPTDDIATLAHQVLEAPPVSPSQLDPRVDAELDTICLKCLEKVPRDRYASTHDLAADLERWLREEPIAARRPGAWRRGKVWARRHPRSFTALALLALVLLVAGLGALRWQALEGKRLERLRQEAAAAVDRGAWAEAEARYEEWLGHDGASDVARDGRDAARAVQQAQHAEADFERALAAVSAVRRGEREVDDLQRQAALGAAAGGAGLGLGAARGSEPWWMREPAWTARVRAERRASALVRERAEAQSALAVALAAADAAAPRAGAEGARVLRRLREGVAAWHMEEWRRALASRDDDQAALHRLAVERLDLAPHAEELEGDGTLTIEPAEPAGRTWLYRYERAADVLPRGGPRWIPLPFSPRAPRDMPARVPAVYAALLARRLADEGSRPPAPDVPAPASATPDDAAHVGTAVGPLRRTRWLQMRDESSYPLAPDEQGDLGSLTSERTLTLPPGRYLLLVSAEGFVPRRLPFEVARRGDVRLTPGPLTPAGLPAGFVEVSGGPYAGPTGPVVGPFLAERLEVSFEDYWQFLNDPRTLAEIRRTQERGWRFVPRNADGPLSLPSPSDGSFEAIQNPSRPVTHVSLFDLVGYPEPPEGEPEPLDGQIVELAEALAASRTVGWSYLAWRTERSRLHVQRTLAGESGLPDVRRSADPATGAHGVWALRFTLPTEAEWLRMASGGQTRAYVFGDEFDWAYAKAGRSRRANAAPEPGGLFPDDESVVGVRDLAGSVAEWTASWSEKGNAFAVRGGSWAALDPAQLRIDARRTERPKSAPATVGIRVIVRETESVR